MKITNKDPFYISLVKGFVRASSGAALLMGNVPLAGLLLIAAEILGVAVAEEL